MFVSDELDVMQEYLKFRADLGIISKVGRHIFVTSNTELKEVVYSMEEFQYHGHTGEPYNLCFALQTYRAFPVKEVLRYVFFHAISLRKTRNLALP